MQIECVYIQRLLSTSCVLLAIISDEYRSSSSKGYHFSQPTPSIGRQQHPSHALISNRNLHADFNL